MVEPNRDYTADRTLYHVMLISSHLQKNPHGEILKIQVMGTYTALPAAKSMAHCSLFDLGYEKEWFSEYQTVHDSKDGEIVRALAPDGTHFLTRIFTTQGSLDDADLKENQDDHRVSTNLYYVLEIKTKLESERPEINLEGIFTTYTSAKKYAAGVLLYPEAGVDKQSYARYDETEGKQLDCGFSENVLVHAVTDSGENFLVCVIKGEVMESVRVSEAASRIQ